MIEKAVGLPADDALAVSAKTGEGVAKILEAVVHRLPPPRGDADAPLQALIFDSWFDPYRGVIVLARIINGRMRKGMKIKIMSNGKQFDVESMGVMTPKPVALAELSAGEVGFFVATIKNVADTKVGDTITDVARPCAEALPGFEDIKSMVFAGLYTVDSHEHGMLRDALEKLRLNDASFTFEPESPPSPSASASAAASSACSTWRSFRSAWSASTISTSSSPRPASATRSPSPTARSSRSTIPRAGPTPPRSSPSPSPSSPPRSSPTRSTSAESSSWSKRSAAAEELEYVTSTRVMITYELPLNEIVLDFYDRLKTVSRGYASLDYTALRQWISPMVKLDILIGGDPVDALSIIVHRDFAYDRGRALVSKMRQLIPRQMFEVAIQAAIGVKVIARETVTALRKNVIAKCYGGDISRKRKLLEKQKEGKKRMKRIGKVDIPQEAFLAVLKVGEESAFLFGLSGRNPQNFPQGRSPRRGKSKGPDRRGLRFTGIAAPQWPLSEPMMALRPQDAPASAPSTWVPPVKRPRAAAAEPVRPISRCTRQSPVW
jgi:GTP-binding protein LepA